MKMYNCPFCKLDIDDNVDSLAAHRKPGGVCDRRMAAREEQKAKEAQ
jgi:hypothetical protein